MLFSCDQVLATGLSGLYSVLPRKLLVVTEDRYQLLSADSKQVPELHSFVCSLDFCNAVLQVCDGQGQGRLRPVQRQGDCLCCGRFRGKVIGIWLRPIRY